LSCTRKENTIICNLGSFSRSSKKQKKTRSLHHNDAIAPFLEIGNQASIVLRMELMEDYAEIDLPMELERHVLKNLAQSCEMALYP